MIIFAPRFRSLTDRGRLKTMVLWFFPRLLVKVGGVAVEDPSGPWMSSARVPKREEGQAAYRFTYGGAPKGSSVCGVDVSLLEQ